MGNETSKANKRRIGTWLFNKVFVKKVIDIGAGHDCIKKEDFPNITSVDRFDKNSGDAQLITNYRKIESYETVYSSHCLEHLKYPKMALLEWWQLLKFDCYLILVVPCEDLYEQGRFQTRSHYSREHKCSFTIKKAHSWCTHSINILDLIGILDHCQIIKIELVDTNYDYSLPVGKQDQSMGVAEVGIEVILKKIKNYGNE